MNILLALNSHFLTKNSMATTVEIAQRLAAHFIKASYKEHAVRHIFIEINCLSYQKSKQPLEDDLKIAIVELIEYYINDSRCQKIFQQYKPSLLRKLKENIYIKEKEERPEYFSGEQFKGLLSYVVQKTNEHFHWLNKRN